MLLGREASVMSESLFRSYLACWGPLQQSCQQDLSQTGWPKKITQGQGCNIQSRYL